MQSLLACMLSCFICSPNENIPKIFKTKEKRENLVKSSDRYVALESPRRRFELSLLQLWVAIRRVEMQGLLTYRDCRGEQGQRMCEWDSEPTESRRPGKIRSVRKTALSIVKSVLYSIIESVIYAMHEYKDSERGDEGMWKVLLLEKDCFKCRISYCTLC
jgi:hypothetical protein